MSTSDLVDVAEQREPNADFFDWLKHMREHEPVSYNPKTFRWQVFRHADAERVLASSDVFVNDMTEITPPQEDYDVFFKGNIAAMDEPRHRKFRMLVSKAFSAKYIASQEAKIGATVAELLDGLGDRDEFDMAAEFGLPFPLTVIADMLGAPRADRPLFELWADVLHASNLGAEGHETTSRHLKTLNEYLFEQIRQRRAQPGDDLISIMVRAELDGRTLADEEIVGFAGVLLMGGITTTAASISNIVLTFNRFPELYQQVRADRSLVPPAIEEVIRTRTPFSNFMRMTSEDVEIGGQIIPAGELVQIWLCSANRDETAYPDPDRFDIHRKPNRHIAFGQGIHFCIGAPLARMETKIAFNALLDRYREIRVVPGAEVTYLDTADMVGASTLPVTVSRA